MWLSSAATFSRERDKNKKQQVAIQRIPIKSLAFALHHRIGDNRILRDARKQFVLMKLVALNFLDGRAKRRNVKKEAKTFLRVASAFTEKNGGHFFQTVRPDVAKFWR